MQMDKKATVLLVTDGLGLAGAERQLFLTATNLPENWHVVVWSLHDGYFSSKLKEKNVPVVVSPGNGSKLKALTSLKETCSGIRPDLIHVWGSASLFLVDFLYRKKIPILNGTIRRSILPSGWLNRQRIRISSRLGDLTVSNSKAGIDTLGLSSSPHTVIHNGFSMDRVQTSSPVPMDSAKTNVVMCANVKPGKDYALLVRAANLALNKYGKEMPYKFWCIGNIADNQYHEMLCREGEKLLSTDGLIFVGSSDSPADYYASADIGILLSNPRYHAEGISNSIMEYMASSLPVICSDSGGNRELVLEGVTGFILDTEKEHEVFLKLEALRLDHNIADSMGTEGRKRIQTEFSLEKMIETTESVYRDLL